jgi:hypothetical protein
MIGKILQGCCRYRHLVQSFLFPNTVYETGSTPRDGGKPFGVDSRIADVYLISRR